MPTEELVLVSRGVASARAPSRAPRPCPPVPRPVRRSGAGGPGRAAALGARAAWFARRLRSIWPGSLRRRAAAQPCAAPSAERTSRTLPDAWDHSASAPGARPCAAAAGGRGIGAHLSRLPPRQAASAPVTVAAASTLCVPSPQVIGDSLQRAAWIRHNIGVQLKFPVSSHAHEGAAAAGCAGGSGAVKAARARAPSARPCCSRLSLAATRGFLPS